MLEVKWRAQDSGHTTLPSSSPLPSCYPKVNEGDRDIPSLTFSCHLKRQPEEKRTAPLHWNNPHMVLELPEKVWAVKFPWRQLVFSPSLLESKSELRSLKEMMKNLWSQLSCYNKNCLWTKFSALLCLSGKSWTKQRNSASQGIFRSRGALEIKWSTEGNHDSFMLSVSQSTDRISRTTAAVLSSHSVTKTFI